MQELGERCFKMMVGDPDVKRQSGLQRCNWGTNIEMNITWYEVVGSIQLAEDTAQSPPSLNSVMKFLFQKKKSEFATEQLLASQGRPCSVKKFKYFNRCLAHTSYKFKRNVS
jgi:hypothetical protein